MSLQMSEIRHMSVKERLRLVGDIWDSLAESGAEIPLTAAMRRELDRRAAAHRRNPSAATPWTAVKARLERRPR